MKRRHAGGTHKKFKKRAAKTAGMNMRNPPRGGFRL